LEGVDIKCDLVKDSPNSPNRIVRTIALKGPLDEEQKIRLIQIADLCPVHKMLSGGIKIESKTA
jgi:putative redox protein